MKNFIQSKSLPLSALCALLFLSACDASTSNSNEASSEEKQQKVESVQSSPETANDTTETDKADLKSGNFFYIARDVADVQLKAGDYISQLQQSQSNLQQALEAKDIQQLESTVTALKTQLTGFNTALDQLNLKSTEINDIRENIMNANTQALKLPLLNGEVDFSQVDFKKIEQQLGSVQGEMLKLAALLIPKSNSTESSES